MQRLKNSRYRLRIAVIMGIAGMLLIMISEFTDNDEPENEGPKTVTNGDTYDESESYRHALERELKVMLEQMEGVGSCSVLITLEGTSEYIYAQDQNDVYTADGERAEQRMEGKIVFQEKGGEKDALVRIKLRPPISGVLVVCTGGGDARTVERVIKAVSQAFGISSSRICVEEKKL